MRSVLRSDAAVVHSHRSPQATSEPVEPSQPRPEAMEAFEYTPLQGRVVFGRGTLARIADEVHQLGCRRAFILSDAHHAEGAAAKVLQLLGEHVAGFSTDAAMHTPVEVTEQVLQRLGAAAPDCLVSLGGGSTTGLSKALALRTGLPQIVVPTTYAGSEATPILGQTEQGRKTTLRSPKVLPRTIVYDVELTLSMPARLSVVSGMNAMAHAVEALYAKDGNPVTAMLAEQGIAALARALPLIAADTRNIEARSDALFGAWACGVCLGTVGMALHHKLCHTLGGSFDLPHAETHTVILPHAAAFNESSAPQALQRVARALGVDNAAAGLFDLAESLGAPTSLQGIGMSESDLDKAAEIATSAPYWNPRPVDRDAIRLLLEDAFQGRRPQN
jgi:maleylacetate reductase